MGNDFDIITSLREENEKLQASKNMSYKETKMITTDCHHGKLDEHGYRDGLLSPEEAIKIMTDEWIDNGNWCRQTLYDLLDVYSDIVHKTTPNNVVMNSDKCGIIIKKLRDMYIDALKDIK